jgi:hypothetical protein
MQNGTDKPKMDANIHAAYERIRRENTDASGIWDRDVVLQKFQACIVANPRLKTEIAHLAAREFIDGELRRGLRMARKQQGSLFPTSHEN